MPRELHFGGLRTGAPLRVFLATPVTEKAEPEHLISLLASQIALTHSGIDYDYTTLVGDCHVDDARNALVRNFLESDCTDLVFLDGDVGFDAVDLVRLLSFDADVVAGAYPRKTDTDQGFPVRFFEGIRVTNPQGLIEVLGAPTGFMRIRREVLEKMYEQEPRKHLGSEEAGRKPIAILFERLYTRTETVLGNRLSGDYGFCEKARELGFHVFIEPNMTFAHVGTKVWHGNCGKYLCNKAEILSPRFVAAFTRIRLNRARLNDFEILFEEWDNNFSFPPNFCASLFEIAKDVKGPILELGSGLTTLLLALSGNPVESVEHDLDWLLRMQKALKQLKLTNVKITHSPLLQKKEGAWYSEVPQGDFKLVFCDGPQQRWLRENLFLSMTVPDDAAFIADDASNPTWITAIEAWAASRGRMVQVLEEGPRRCAVVAPLVPLQEAAE